ncbi:MAG: hypothetical protein GF346_00365, partial [Candidatus Eisenbacteria bacterium]|nr:hypothetical protein [Candidatus Eisenbacteria bacterium]
MSGSTSRKISAILLPLLAVLVALALGLGAGPDSSVRVAFAQVDIEEAAEPEGEGGDTLPEASAPPAEKRWRGTREDIVRMGESIVVEADEKVSGDVVAIGGVITVYGYVTGDVVSVGGGVRVRDEGYVGGDAVSVGGRIQVDEDATVRGENVSVGFMPFGFPGTFTFGDFTHEGPESTLLHIWWDLIRYAGFFLIALILYLAFSTRFTMIQERVRSNFWLCLVTGFGAGLGVIVVLLLLIITCIGILIAVPGFFVVVLAYIAGGAAILGILGELILKRPSRERSDWILAFGIGLLALFVIQLFSRLVAMTPGIGAGISGALNAIVKAAWFFFLTTGFGAVVLSRLGAGPRKPPAVLGAESPPPPPPGGGAVPPGGAPPAGTPPA